MNIEPQNNPDLPASVPDIQHPQNADEARSPAGGEAGGGETAQDREAMYRLVQNNRINQGARMPINQPSADRDELIRRLSERLDRTGISLKSAARQILCSASTLSEYRQGKYKGNNDEVDGKVRRWLNKEALRDYGLKPKDHVETRISEEVRSIIHLAYRHNAMATIVAPSGCGKTFVGKAICSELNGIFVTANQTFTALEFLTQLAIEIGWPKGKRAKKAEFHRWIVAALKGSNRPVFIDEAHLLGKIVNFVRGIHDEAETPVVLIGTAEILDYVDDRGHGNGQFASRTITYNAVEKSRGMSGPSDGAKGAAQCLFSIEEVKAFFASREIRLDKESLKLAWQLANLPGFGSLRLVERAAAVVFDIAPDTETIQRDQFVMALRLLHSADFERMERLVRQRTEETKVAAVA